MKLKRHLGSIEIFAISSGAMISAGLFVLPGLAFASSGPSMCVAYLLAGVTAPEDLRDLLLLSGRRRQAD